MSKKVDRSAVSVMFSFRFPRADYMRMRKMFARAKRARLSHAADDMSSVIRSLLVEWTDRVERELSA